MKNVTILGGTGSIGTQTLEVIRSESDSFKLAAISANSSYDKMIKIINEFAPKYVAMKEPDAFKKVKEYCTHKKLDTIVLEGMEGIIYISSIKDSDIVVTSIVGMIGLKPTLCAINAGKDIALANKETLVVGGEIVIDEARKNGVNIIPVDSEHGAIFQCLQGRDSNLPEKIILTASGGPFRGKHRDELCNVSVDQALKHPKWNMGKKISIDSATLMNKGLEVIEAHWLFNVKYDDIQVVVHPQSIIHSMVEYKDGSIIAQMGSTDMKLPIQYALNYPERKEAVVKKLDFYNMSPLTFEKPDYSTFRCLKLAYEAGREGGLLPTIMNAANEAAVELFIDKKINFLQIADIVEECMIKFNDSEKVSLENIMERDSIIRAYVNKQYN